jgi:hypothetical protein
MFFFSSSFYQQQSNVYHVEITENQMYWSVFQIKDMERNLFSFFFFDDHPNMANIFRYSKRCFEAELDRASRRLMPDKTQYSQNKRVWTSLSIELRA